MKLFRIVGYSEGVSLLVLLFIAMPMKYVWGIRLAVKVVGWIHGLLFMAYIGVMASVQAEENWPARKVAYGFIAATLPFGPFVFDRYANRE